MNIHGKLILAGAAAIAACGFVGPAQAYTLVCESQGNRQQFCPADTSGGVVLATQFSKSSCRQGSSWGYDNRGIWVSNGCRAQFDLGEYRSRHSSNDDSKAAAALAIGLIGAAAIASRHDHDHDNRDRGGNYGYDYGYNHNYQPNAYHSGFDSSDHVTCESRDNRYTRCPANLRHAEVDIERQLSNTYCRLGQNWGWDAGGIWVNDGCRAVFSIY